MRYLTLLMLVFPFSAMAASAVNVHNGWAPPSLSQPNSVAFLSLKSTHDDVLLSATSDCCDAVELHTHIMEDDVMRMRRVKDGIPLPAGKHVALRPGGYHIMLIGLKEPLEDGAVLPLTLHFKNAEDETVQIPIDRAKLRAQLQQNRHH